MALEFQAIVLIYFLIIWLQNCETVKLVFAPNEAAVFCSKAGKTSCSIIIIYGRLEVGGKTILPITCKIIKKSVNTFMEVNMKMF